MIFSEDRFTFKPAEFYPFKDLEELRESGILQRKIF